MKTIVITAFLLGLFVQYTLGQGAQADQIKRRARELNNQNNVRQGVTPPAQAPTRPVVTPRPAATPVKAAPPTAATVQQQNVTRIQTELAAIKAGSPLTDEQKKKLTATILAAARGPKKPTTATVTKFVNDFASALGGKTLATEQQTRLAQNLEALVNSASLPASQSQAIAEDVQAILQVAGAKRADAASAATAARAITAELVKAR